MAHPPTRPSGPFRPTRLGQWEVIAKIAGGGMSAVYLGRKVGSGENLSDIPTVVALKIVRHDVRNEKMLQMFLEEGRLIARLVHPNIVRTLEVGGDAEQDFIAMELMLGKTFAAIHDAIVARDVRLNPEIAAWTAARVADALHYAHELADEQGRPLGLVHRDVNPANIFATFNGEIKLFDFGLAKSTAGEASGSHLLAGKLSYLSPEQIMQMPLDRRSDIFSLGTTLWELLTGRRLFRRESDLDTVRAVQLGPIPDPRTVAPEIPEELARIAKTALERNREHRYPTATYLARELDAFVYTRTSPGDVTARLAQLVDTLFPGEQKKQHGWLKPAINKAMIAPTSGIPGPVSMMQAPSQSPSSRQAGWASSGRPSPPPRSLSPRETTAVMPNAPRRPESSPNFGDAPTMMAPSVPTPSPSSPGSSPRLPPSSPRLPSSPASSPDMATLSSRPPASRPSIPSAPRSSQRIPISSPPDTTPTTLPDPPSLVPTPREGVTAAMPQSSAPPREPTAPANAPLAASAGSGRTSWPMPPAGGGRRGPSVPPPPQRNRPASAMGTREQPQAQAQGQRPSVPAPPPSPTPGSRTDIQAVAPPLVATAAATAPPAKAAARPEESTPSIKPQSLAGGFQRPKRAPIPLPSRLKNDAAAKKPGASIPPPATTVSPGVQPAPRPSQAPAPMTKPSVGMGMSRPQQPTVTTTAGPAAGKDRTKPDTDPPNSDTQVDMQVPPPPGLPKGS